MFEVRIHSCRLTNKLIWIPFVECIVYTWDYHSSIAFWTGLRVQPILSDEVQTFKALITVHKVIQEGHPVVRCILIRVGLSLTSPCRPSKRHTGRLDGSKPARGRLVAIACEVSWFMTAMAILCHVYA